MDIVKLVAVALLFSVLIVYLQSINREIALIVAIVAGIIILMSVLDSVYQVFSLYEDIADIGGLDSEILKIIIKITLICYLVEFACGIIEDFGLKSLADKVSVAGKLLILIIATPVITSLLNLIKSLIR